MRIESVRELKDSLFEQFTAPDSWAGPPAATFARKLPRPSPLIGLGLALGVAAHPNRPNDYRLAIRVSEPLFSQSARSVTQIVDQARGEVDIRRVGIIGVATDSTASLRQRPLSPGCSVGHHAVTAGTLGGFVRQRGDPRPMILSNNHILADEDTGRIGDEILQPGSYDGGCLDTDAIGTLHQFVPLTAHGNLVDAALAVLDDPSDVPTSLSSLRSIAQAPFPGMNVRKVGRTTGSTHGTVTAVELRGVAVSFRRAIRLFDDQIEITGSAAGPFGAAGDSGSVVYSNDGDAIGLLFACSETGGEHGNGLTYANDIRNVVASLDLEHSS